MSDHDDVAAALSQVVMLDGPTPQAEALGAWHEQQVAGGQARLAGLPTGDAARARLTVALEVASAAIGTALELLREGE
jgi:hypothetical protein